ncbi:unnamed protein product [Paramecium sonneborni]|uniref:Uncharacterized protein n=1 Tax=Paramecium sonneborni TaxID=65129 RepID=A0A8S1RPP6_9CILI|nr:unnamed protein product [Paramecium sonneborni]
MIDCYYVVSLTNDATTIDSECQNMDCYGSNQNVKTNGLCNPFKITSSDGKSKTITFLYFERYLKKCIKCDYSNQFEKDNQFIFNQLQYLLSILSKHNSINIYSIYIIVVYPEFILSNTIRTYSFIYYSRD